MYIFRQYDCGNIILQKQDRVKNQEVILLYKKSLITKLEYKFGRFAIQNFMTVIVGTMALVYVLDSMFMTRLGQTLSSYLAFDRAAILGGEVWRLITFALIPPNSSLMFIIFSLYFYWIIGSTLEREWGAFKFNLFYFCGMLGIIIAGFITGYSTNYYLNMSLFFAFALLYPDFELYLFFILPIKIKYLAFADLLLFCYSFIISSWADRAAIVMSLINVAIFFFGDFKSMLLRAKYNYEMKKRFKR